MHENELVGGTHFHISGLTRGLVLKQRQRQLENGLENGFCIRNGVRVQPSFSDSHNIKP